MPPPGPLPPPRNIGVPYGDHLLPLHIGVLEAFPIPSRRATARSRKFPPGQVHFRPFFFYNFGQIKLQIGHGGKPWWGQGKGGAGSATALDRRPR
jgi:hypothetical protein